MSPGLETTLNPVAATAFASWTFSPGLLFGLGLTALVYLRGFGALHRARPERFPRRRRTAFLAGLVTLWIALASPLDAFAGFLLQVHMIQHLLLMLVAPPLLLLGAPLAPLLRGLPTRVRKFALGPFLASPGLQQVGRTLVHPISGWLALGAATWIWHVPAAYELALRSSGWHAFEHATFFAAALLFWWPVLEPWPARAPWPRAAMILYLVLADLQNTALSALFAFSDRVLYPTYAQAPRLFGTSALSDQAAAGALMWVLGSLGFLLPVGWILRRMLDPASLHRPGPPAKPSVLRTRASSRVFDLLTVPTLGRALRSLAFRRSAQAFCLLLAAAVVLDGVLGPQMSPMNLAGVLPWTFGRGLVVVALLGAGNLFCFACPFMLTRDLGRRFLPARLRFPRWLASKWLAVGLLVAYLAAYEMLGLWDDPRATAGILVGYFVAAFAVDGLFRGASFCKYVCPIGQFNFLGSTVSPLEVSVRSRDVCTACSTRDCIRGNEVQRGCELALFAPAKVGNLDCTFCLDCVRACPHDNIGLLARMPGVELAQGGPRSSLGRLARRPDLAALALIFVAGAFVNAAGMVAPVTSALDAFALRLGSLPLAQCVGLFAALVVVPAGLLALCSLLSHRLGAISRPRREIATRFALALLPLGIAMWSAHLLFHLVTGIASLVPVLQRLAASMGSPLLGAPDWTMAHASGAPGPWLSLEILLLDAGFLLTLTVAWRIARGLVPGLRRRMAAVLPFALLATVGWLVGLWLLVQPMQMRGMMMHG